MIEISVHDINTSEKLGVYKFKNIQKSNEWIHNEWKHYPHAHQLRTKTIPDQPSIVKRHKILAIAIPLGLTAVGICYYLLHYKA